MDKDELYVLDELDLTIKMGEIVGIKGSSARERSTLLYILAGFKLLDSGTMIFDGEDITRASFDRIRHIYHQKMALIKVPFIDDSFKHRLKDSQFKLIPNYRLSVEKFIVSTFGKTAFTKKYIKSLIHETIEEMGLIDDISQFLSKKPITALLPREQLVAFFAHAMVSKPYIILIDSLKSFYYPKIINDLKKIIGLYKEKGITVICVIDNDFIEEALKDLLDQEINPSIFKPETPEIIN
jgi:ABC-type branched-subunit amino acid transport system ATPase component